ncbi:hypothetical protein T492DRAFT_1143317 [Pavlovales sp. CCMP2436]|nr:hypothetical protein T492DRAFT_1143317 [Pavlovales sp. CCMP2436]
MAFNSNSEGKKIGVNIAQSDVARGFRSLNGKAYMDSKGNARRRARRHLKGDARRAAVTALSSSHGLIALVRAYAGYTKPAASSSSAASEGDDDLDDEESQETEGENDHLLE